MLPKIMCFVETKVVLLRYFIIYYNQYTIILKQDKIVDDALVKNILYGD